MLHANSSFKEQKACKNIAMQLQRRSRTIAGDTLSVSITIKKSLQVDQGSCIFPTWFQSSHPCNPEASALPFPTPRPSPESPDVFRRTKDLHASDQNRIHRTSCCDHRQIIRSDTRDSYEIDCSPDTEIPCSRPWNFDHNEKQKQTGRPHPKALNSEISHPAAPSSIPPRPSYQPKQMTRSGWRELRLGPGKQPGQETETVLFTKPGCFKLNEKNLQPTACLLMTALLGHCSVILKVKAESRLPLKLQKPSGRAPCRPHGSKPWSPGCLLGLGFRSLGLMV